MSREDVELLYATYRRFNDGDHDAVLEAVDRDVVLRDRTLPDYAEEVVGRAAYAGYLQQLRASFGDLSYEIESVEELGDRLVVKVRATAVGADTGAGVSGVMGHVWRMAGGKGTRVDIYATWEETLDAVGLRE
ncbi:MAG TPA: nuclear transport factor 2 family protein [Solirubrobacteraceae bacterium]|nr:nuclear transport factor 2 family protein [Solirubrobacteraceae bacterium]